MTPSLREVLKQRSAVYAAEAEKNRHIIADWQTAVDTLFKQLCGWLVMADPDRMIQHYLSDTEVNEPGLGRYPISTLNLRAFGKWVGVIPKARKTVKTASPQQSGAPERATGRVDITDEIRRYVLYRFTRETGDEWFIDDPATTDGLQPLNAERFDAALASYFQ